MDIKEFIVGNTYTNADISDSFKVSLMRGMARSLKTNSLVLTSKHTSLSTTNPYEDKWVGDILHYTGEGKNGDQSLQKGQNKTLLESNQNGITVYLFEVLKPSEYTYRGIVRLQGKPYLVTENDVSKTSRLVYKFPLELTSKSALSDIDTLKSTVLKKQKSASRLNEKDLENAAKNISKLNEELYRHSSNRNSSYRKVISRSFDRDPYIAKYVKLLAKGICSLCDEPAPFKDKNGEAFLHSHHIEYLSEGGKDIIDNCIAICPNCHAKVHALNDPLDRNKLIQKVISRKNKKTVENFNK